MSTLSHFQRLKRRRMISPFNGYQFKEAPSYTNPVRSGSYNVYKTKYEKPEFHNYLTNLRNTEACLKDQNLFEDTSLSRIEAGQEQSAGFDQIGKIIVKRKMKLLSQRKQRREAEELKKSQNFDKKLDLEKENGEKMEDQPQPVKAPQHNEGGLDDSKGPAKLKTERFIVKRSSRQNTPRKIRKKVIRFKDVENPEKTQTRFSNRASSLPNKLKKAPRTGQSGQRKANPQKRRFPSLSGKRLSSSLKMDNRWHSSLERQKDSLNKPMPPSFAEFTSYKTQKRSETDLMVKDFLSRDKSNIRRYSNNLKSLNQFIKHSFKSKIHKRDKSIPVTSKDTVILFGQNKFDVNPMDYRRQMRYFFSIF